MVTFNGERLIRVEIYCGDYGQPEVYRLGPEETGGRYVPERLVLAYEAAEEANRKTLRAYWKAGEAVQNWEGQQ